MILEHLRQLDLKEIGSWPLPAKGAALGLLFAALLAAGWSLHLSGELAEYEEVHAREETLKRDYVTKKGQAANLNAYKRQLDTIDKALAAFVEQLPGRQQMDSLLNDINQAGVKRDLQFHLFRPAKGETLHEFYAERAISIKVVGTYHQIAHFVSDVSQLPRIVTLSDVSMVAERRNDKGDKSGVRTGDEKTGRLILEANAHTYRYLDAAEITAQKKAAAEAGKKARKKAKKT